MTEELTQKIESEDENLNLEDLFIIKRIAKGFFSRIYLVESESQNYYALKAYSRRKIKKLCINQQIIVKYK